MSSINLLHIYELSRTDNSPFSYNFEKEKSHRNKTARTEESESPIPFERAAKKKTVLLDAPTPNHVLDTDI